MFRPLDRPGYELWKKGNESEKIQDIMRRFKLFLVNVNRVTKLLKSVKADTDRKNNMKRIYINRYIHFSQHPDKAINKEVEVFKETQKAKIKDDTHQNEPLSENRILCFPDLMSQKVINRRTGKYQQQKSPIPPAIKEIAYN